MRKSVAILGAGLGGLSSAIVLAKLGYDVNIYEKNNHVGGKLNQFTQDGFNWDIGPTLLTMPFVIENLFDFVGENLNDYIEIKPLDCICRYFYENGKIVDTFSDFKKLNDSFVKAGFDTTNLRNYFNYSKNLYDLTADLFLFEEFGSQALKNWKKAFKALLNLKSLDTNKTVHQANSKYFKDNELQQLFDRYATYNGSDPYKAPATLNIITHVEYTMGSYYIDGGMYKLALALEQIAVKLGVNIHLNSKVDDAEISHNYVNNIIVNQRKLSFDYLVVNADIVEFYKMLGMKHKVEKLEPSMSGMIFLWGIDKKLDSLEHHNIFFSKDYKQEFNSLTNELKAPKDPTIYLSIKSRINPDSAPSNSESLFVLLNMPYLDKKNEFDIEAIRKSVLDKLKRNGIDIENSIVTEKIISPNEMYSMYLSNKGSIYGISSNNKLSAFLRHKNSNHFKNVFFSGGSVHPGGGIPLTLLSGMLAAKALLRKESKNINPISINSYTKY